MNNSGNSPNLVEPGIHKYVSLALEKCHTNRVVVYYWILNVGVVVMVGIVVALFVYYSLSKKLSPQEYRNKMIQDHEAVLRQIRVYKEEQNKIHQFTALPLTKKRGEEATQMRDIFMP